MADNGDNTGGKNVAAPRAKQTTIQPPVNKGRVTFLGPAQAMRVTFPDVKTGGLITNAFSKQYRSGPPNEAARAAGTGKHVYGKLDLPQFEEPCFTDFGKNASSGGGTALVIGNQKYDLSKKMGSTAIQNRDIDKAHDDADKVEKALASKGFSVKKLYDQKGAGISKAVSDSSSAIQPGKCFLFYFCGHGTFDGLIGTDGVAAPPSVLTALIPVAIKTECDLVIIADACHQGSLVDAGRTQLFDFAKNRDAAKPKMLEFITAAKSLAVAKDQLNQAMRSVLEGQWKIEDTANIDIDKWTAQYNKRSEAWNAFIASGQRLVDEAVSKRNAVKKGLASLTLSKCAAKVEQDEEKKIWAQLDSIDIILNQAVSGDLSL